MSDFKHIYASQAEEYDLLVSAEDYEQNLIAALAGLFEPAGARVLEIGVGTGRVTRQLVELGAEIAGYEQSAAMLDVARDRLPINGWSCEIADVRECDLGQGWADAAVAGWVLGHFCDWYANAWETEIDAVLQRMRGALKPGGVLILVETLGTGALTPAAPTAALAAYYAHLEAQWGMRRAEIRTDYRFASAREAADRLEFFFGPELAARILANDWRVVPEWTGVWSRRAG